jgi:hypothetical protein
MNFIICLIKCKDNIISHTRQTCLPRMYSTNPNTYKLSNLFNNKDINKICILVKVIEQTVKHPDYV